MECYQEEFVSEYSTKNQFQNYTQFSYKKKPTTSLDFMKFNSEEHLKYKFEQKVKEQIKELNLDERLFKEIVELSYSYIKLFKNSKDINLKKSDVISIITFKIAKKYSMPFTLNEICEKVKLDKAKFLKFSNLFKIGEDLKVIDENENMFLNVNFFINENKFVYDDSVEINKYNNDLLHYLNFMINRLYNLYSLNPNIFKIQTSKINIDNYLNKLSMMLENKLENTNNKKYKTLNTLFDFNDNLKILEEVKLQSKEIILSDKNNNKLSENNFYNHFHNKISIDGLISGLIKYLLERKGIKINLQIFKENFRISNSSISRAIKMLEEYIKINNVNIQ